MTVAKWSEDDLPPFGAGWEAFVRAERIEHPDGRVSHRPPRHDRLPPRPAVVFPPGVGYREAVEAFHAARHAGRALPPDAALAAPLPPGICVEVRADGRLALDPSAPLGFEPTSGAAIDPAFTLPAEWDEDEIGERFAEQRREGLALPRGAELLVEPPDPSQVLVADEARHLWPPAR